MGGVTCRVGKSCYPRRYLPLHQHRCLPAGKKGGGRPVERSTSPCASKNFVTAIGSSDWSGSIQLTCYIGPEIGGSRLSHPGYSSAAFDDSTSVGGAMCRLPTSDVVDAYVASGGAASRSQRPLHRQSSHESL